MSVNSRKCRRCGIEKSLAEFYDASAPGQKQYWCKKCMCEHATDRLKTAEGREQVARYHWHSNLRRKYGIEPEEYATLLAAQGGGCRICGSVAAARTRQKRLHVDHDHDTGKVRGLLCGKCNQGIGRFLDSPGLMRKAAAYLREQLHERADEEGMPTLPSGEAT